MDYNRLDCYIDMNYVDAYQLEIVTYYWNIRKDINIL